MGKFRASLEPSWALKIARYVQQLMHRSSECAAFHDVKQSRAVQTHNYRIAPNFRGTIPS